MTTVGLGDWPKRFQPVQNLDEDPEEEEYHEEEDEEDEEEE